MDTAHLALLYALMAGAAIPVGGAIARIESVAPEWLDREVRHSVTAFGGGILMAAVALVLVPDGLDKTPGWLGLLVFAAGGLAFALLDAWVKRRGGSAAMFMAMVLDFVPEAIALGSLLAVSEKRGALMALLITAQNLPEGFNAFREQQASGSIRAGRLLVLFAALALLGPLAAGAGLLWLVDRDAILGGLMLFAAGGILYLTFEDIAPGVPLDGRFAPPLGAVGGFALGMAGQVLLG
ncbi:ZIP family zinc transporter [Rhodothalassium salexigens DSM 2132]|uniref:ZIP family zinc transporter n=1 Tax=Rhodothalassium salexigens DSM 2132 TaxID=1188247 RepID=A0A4R2PW69_RHOSA|nr:hypothetical protein [Rhodothalassium salexigens]MBB4210321.1 ZIP family zinc transporter [Rhodothalassium salexigens DSM 2132]TCP38485.1 ZIP family zinc transporter [Rhodothalassium salexigens DSM 2132]